MCEQNPKKCEEKMAAMKNKRMAKCKQNPEKCEAFLKKWCEMKPDSQFCDKL